MLCPAAKGRAIAIPVDLDSQVNNLFVKSNNIVQKTAMSWRMSARNAARRDSVLTASRDYRNIIERLQVGERACVCVCVFGGVGCRCVDGLPLWPLQDIVSALEDRLRPLVQAELSVLVDVLHRPELLFPENTDSRRKCESGGFICKSVPAACCYCNGSTCVCDMHRLSHAHKHAARHFLLSVCVCVCF